MDELKIKQPETTFFKGGNRAVLIMHAYTGSSNDVRMVGRFLNNHGYTVLMPMFSGHGTLRPEDILEAGPKQWKKDCEASIRFLQEEGFEEIAVFGLSLGGVFAVGAMEDYPEVVIGGGPFCSPLLPEAKTNIVPQFLYYAKTVMEKDNVPENEVAQRLITIQNMLKSQLAEISDHTQTIYDHLGAIKQPTMLVQAGKDKMIESKDVYKVQARMVQADAKVFWYPESGHVITVGPERQQLQEDVTTFLNQLKWTKENE